MPRTFSVLILGVVALIMPSHGQCVNGTTTSLAFDDGDGVRIPQPGAAALGGFADVTVEAWFRTASTGFQSLVCSQDNSTLQQAFLLRQSSGSVQLAMNAGQSAIGGGPNLADSAWHHVAVARRASAVNLYLDGTLTTTVTFTAPLVASASDFSIGCHMSIGAPVVPSGFNGDLDEIRVWSVRRTLPQIDSTRFSVLNGNETGLVGHWRFNDGAGQTVTNSATATGASLNGTLGASTAVFTDDPTWTFSTTAPLTQCAPSNGQPNTAAASLRINGVGDIGVNGPFQVIVPTTGAGAGQVTLSWAGPPTAALVLLPGVPQTNAAIIPCVGRLDLTVNGLTVVGDHVHTPLSINDLFVTDTNGAPQTTFTVPIAVLGAPWVTRQGAAFAPSCGGTTPFTLTTALTIR